MPKMVPKGSGDFKETGAAGEGLIDEGPDAEVEVADGVGWIGNDSAPSTAVIFSWVFAFASNMYNDPLLLPLYMNTMPFELLAIDVTPASLPSRHTAFRQDTQPQGAATIGRQFSQDSYWQHLSDDLDNILRKMGATNDKMREGITNIRLESFWEVELDSLEPITEAAEKNYQDAMFEKVLQPGLKSASVPRQMAQRMTPQPTTSDRSLRSQIEKRSQTPANNRVIDGRVDTRKKHPRTNHPRRG
ncbi:hypothetical protein F4803DRAFT_572100 [Xylaria telfairii]|nr:hypothetical protein F4803DRAFT_572100 [Xylaria telfairii]